MFLKTQPKHRQVISSKLPKSFIGARDLMAFYEFLSDFSDFQKLIKHHQITSTPKGRFFLTDSNF